MKRIPSCNLLLSLSLVLASLGTTSASHYAIGETQAFSDVDCLSVVTGYDGATDPSKRLMLTCLTDEYQFLVVPDATANWITERLQNGQLKSGSTRLRFPAATQVSGFLVDRLPDHLDNDDSDDEIIVGNTRRLAAVNETGSLASRRRRLMVPPYQKKTGTWTIAIMRVEDDFYGKTTTPSAAELIAENLHPTDVNIRTQTAACSYNQLTLNVGTGNELTDGVGTVTPINPGTGLKEDPGNGNLDDPVEFNKFIAYVNAIIGPLYVANGNSIPVDFLQLCIPPSTITSAQTLSFYNEFISVFNSEVCTSVSYNIHEFGHNILIENSADALFAPGIGDQGDQVGYMGLSYINQVHTPRMCFNPARSYQLGWYTSKTVTCDAANMPCNINVGGFVKYGDAGVATVLVKINDPVSALDYYLTYNEATGFNEGTAEGANKVVINSMPNGDAVGPQPSNLVGILGAGQSFYEVGTFNGADYLQVDVTSITAGIASIVVSTGPGIPPGSLGDPHFRTWHNEHYEYHGQCDLVLVKDPTFAHGKGLEVQIRTKVIRYWSYIKSAAIRIGTDILEVQGDADMQGIAKYWVNLEYQPSATSIAGFPLTVHVRSERKRIVTIDLDSVYKGQKIVISTWKEFVKVDFVGANRDAYGNSVGMLGDFATGKTLARDGVTVMNDFWQFGEEWQVLPTDDMLFHGVEYPQFPEKCVEPEEALGKRRRRLDESSVTEEEAEAACRKNLKYADPLTLKDCVYDILATQDLDMVGAF